MIKQTLYFGSPVYLRLKNKQLEIVKSKDGQEEVIRRAIEDIGMLVLDCSQITISHNAIIALQSNKAVIISCDNKHLPHSILLPLEGHSEQSERYRNQISASVPLKKMLWQQTITAKIANQITVLEKLGRRTNRLENLVQKVQSGDPTNVEGQAAAFYWSKYIDGFIRDQYGEIPNNYLNYGYAIVRAMLARAIVSSGMLPTIGIHHKNKYNAYCLADDIMEPFRPFVDLLVYGMYTNKNLDLFLDKSDKADLLSICQVDAFFGKKKSPLMVGVSMTTSSLYDCFVGKKRKIIYPKIL